MPTIRIADGRDKECIDAFYASEKRHVDVGTSERFVIAENNGIFIGVMRLCKEEGEYILRTMYISEVFRGKGLGREMLKVFEPLIEGKICYCLPFEHLAEFYGSIGFKSIAIDLAPPHVQKRLTEYIRKGLSIIVMMRSA